jgi:hypothetical protein
MTKAKHTRKSETRKPAAKAHAELSDTALDKASGGSFSWGMQDIHFCDGSVRPSDPATPGLLLPAVKPAGGN